MPVASFCMFMRVIGYSSIDKTFIVSPGPERIAIPYEVAIVLGSRGCAGRWERDLYVPCDRPDSPYCARCCAVADACVICRGDCLKAEMTCAEPHSVYLAVFSPDTVKVGVSRSYRLETRLREQGADEGYEIARFPDGAAARRLERTLSASFPDRIPFDIKFREGDIVRETIDRLLVKHPYDRGFKFEHFRRSLWMRPIVLRPKEGMAISGELIGVKGQAMVLERMGTLYAVNLDSLIGFDIEFRKGKTSLQASLSGY